MEQACFRPYRLRNIRSVSQTDSDLELTVAIFLQNTEAPYVTIAATLHFPITVLYLLLLTFGSSSSMSSIRS